LIVKQEVRTQFVVEEKKPLSKEEKPKDQDKTDDEVLDMHWRSELENLEDLSEWRHYFEPWHREKMVDWMLKVTITQSLSSQTFFLAI